MTAKRIQNSYYVVSDMARACAFYEAVLGLQLKFRDADRWAQYGVNGANFSLSSTTEAPRRVDGGIVVFEVEDIDAVKAKIVEMGGSIVVERDMGDHGRTLALLDSEQNLVQLFQRSK
jgi:predicted enzyme related to lactoylglutathione lyase